MTVTDEQLEEVRQLRADVAEAEHRGARAMLLWLLGAAKITAQDAEDGRRAIEAGWVRVETEE